VREEAAAGVADTTAREAAAGVEAAEAAGAESAAGADRDAEPSARPFAPAICPQTRGSS